MSIYYNGINGYIKTDEVAASDLHVTTGTGKTLVLDTPVWRDEATSALRLQQTGTGVSYNATEATVDFITTTNLSDYIYDNVQLNHDRELTSAVYPHIHFFQTNNNAPNFLIQYRWQISGGTKVTSWTNYKCNTLAYTYTSGTIHQIAYGSALS